MSVINYKNLPNTSTPLNATNLNAMQDDGDTGWVNMTLGTSIVAYSGQNTPAYRRIGKNVYLRGVIQATENITSSNRTITTLPYTTTQYTNTYYPCIMISGSTREAQQIQFTKTGNLLAPTAMQANTWIPLDGIVITLDS